MMIGQVIHICTSDDKLSTFVSKMVDNSKNQVFSRGFGALVHDSGVWKSEVIQSYPH